MHSRTYDFLNYFLNLDDIKKVSLGAHGIDPFRILGGSWPKLRDLLEDIWKNNLRGLINVTVGVAPNVNLVLPMVKSFKIAFHIDSFKQWKAVSDLIRYESFMFHSSCLSSLLNVFDEHDILYYLYEIRNTSHSEGLVRAFFTPARLKAESKK